MEKKPQNTWHLPRPSSLAHVLFYVHCRYVAYSVAEPLYYTSLYMLSHYHSFALQNNTALAPATTHIFTVAQQTRKTNSVINFIPVFLQKHCCQLFVIINNSININMQSLFWISDCFFRIEPQEENYERTLGGKQRVLGT